MVDTNDGRKVPLNYVAEVVSAMGPNTINRENVKRKIVISANVADRDLRSVVNDIQKRIDTSIQLPEGYHIEYGGQFDIGADVIHQHCCHLPAALQRVPQREGIRRYLVEPAACTDRRCFRTGHHDG